MEARVVEERRERKTLMIRGLIPVEAPERSVDVSTLTGVSLTILPGQPLVVWTGLTGPFVW
jgi:hypothetical protein